MLSLRPCPFLFVRRLLFLPLFAFRPGTHSTVNGRREIKNGALSWGGGIEGDVGLSVERSLEIRAVGKGKGVVV